MPDWLSEEADNKEKAADIKRNNEIDNTLQKSDFQNNFLNNNTVWSILPK